MQGLLCPDCVDGLVTRVADTLRCDKCKRTPVDSAQVVQQLGALEDLLIDSGKTPDAKVKPESPLSTASLVASLTYLSKHAHRHNRRLDACRVGVGELLAERGQLSLALPLLVAHLQTVHRHSGESSMKNVYAMLKLATTYRLMNQPAEFMQTAAIMLRIHVQHCGLRHTWQVFDMAGLSEYDQFFTCIARARLAAAVKPDADKKKSVKK